MSSGATQQTAATLQHHLTAIVQDDVEVILSNYTDDSVLYSHIPFHAKE